jgi:hypothetical protein
MDFRPFEYVSFLWIALRVQAGLSVTAAIAVLVSTLCIHSSFWLEDEEEVSLSTRGNEYEVGT